MSGINAHGLFSSNSDASEFQLKVVLEPTAASRCWPITKAHPFLNRTISTDSAQTRFMCRLNHPSSAFLRYHTVHDKVLMPATAFLETMHAAATSTLLLEGSEAVLCGTAIMAPFVLKEEADAYMECTLSLATGTISISSSSASHVSAAVHAGLHDAVDANAAAVFLPGAHSLLNLPTNPRKSLVATLSSSSALQAPDFIIQPALADATLHLGAIVNTFSLVPVGLKTYVARSASLLQSGDVGNWAVAELPRAVANADADQFECSHTLVAAATVAMHCGDLQSKAIRKVKVPKIVEQQQQQQHFTYSIDWQIDAVVDKTTSTPTNVDSCASWRVPSQGALMYPTDTSVPGEFVAINVASLQAFGGQRQSASAVSKNLSKTDAMMAAFVKVAAIENPDLSYSHSTEDAAGEGGSSAVVTQNDAFGVKISSGSVSRPKMLRISM